MNTDDLLVQLDFDETNVNHHLQSQPHSQINSIDSLSTKRIQLQRTSSPSINTSEPILSTGDLLLTDNDNTTDTLNAHHHRRAFSDDNALATVIQTIEQPNQLHSIVKPIENSSLINLSRSHSSVEDDSIGHLEPTTEVITSVVSHGEGPGQAHHHDDTVEVSLLADLSMDSRESQPLLGVGRDAHDFVYNNFPGKFQPNYFVRLNSSKSLQAFVIKRCFFFFHRHKH